MKCEQCRHFEPDEKYEGRWGYCDWLHRDVEWNDRPDLTDCGIDD